jgi:LuxR family maltose regulon positive regulatory protein
MTTTDSTAAARLTARERELLALLATDATPKQIAARLFVSRRTVDFHTANVYAKLGVTSRMGALHAGRRLGLVDW